MTSSSVVTDADRAVTIEYDFKLPSEVNPPKLSSGASGGKPNGSYKFQVNGGSTSDLSSYYESLLVALREAKSATGEDLTAWRDAVGDAEKTKEASMTKPVKEDEEDEDEENEES